MLITQLTRSGGSLLSQLLDGHRECYSFPDELKLNSYSKFDWPTLNNAKNVFRKMYSLDYTNFQQLVFIRVKIMLKD